MSPALNNKDQKSRVCLACPLGVYVRPVILPILGGVPYFEATCDITHGNLKEEQMRAHIYYRVAMTHVYQYHIAEQYNDG